MRSSGLGSRVALGAAIVLALAVAWPRACEASAASGCRIQGIVASANGEPVAGVTVRFSNGLPAQVTDSHGCFEAVAPAGPTQCTVTPTKAGFRFIPAERAVSLSGNEAEASFRAQPVDRRKAKTNDWWGDATELIVDGPAVAGDIWYNDARNWFFFQVATAGIYTIETWKGSLTDNYMDLYDHDLWFIRSDDDGGEGYMARLSRKLNPGIYYVRITAYSYWDSGDYTIRVTSAAPVLSKFAVNNRAAYALARDVTLNHTVLGTPAEYMASESPAFAGAAWLPYVPLPQFTLSGGNDTKTVYLKVRDAAARESNAVSDTIVLHEPVPVELFVNAPPTTGSLLLKGEENVFYFTVADAGTYTIDTWAGSLTDNFLSLYQGDQTTLIASDNDGGEGRMARIVHALAPGTYYVRVRDSSNRRTGTYLIRVMSADTLITILDPHGDPAAGSAAAAGNSEIVFSTRVPGVLLVACSFAVNAPGIADLPNKVRACISPVGDSALQWQMLKKGVSPWTGSAAGLPPGAAAAMGKAVYNAKTQRYEAKAVFTGTPTTNAAFGPKTLWAQIVDGAAVVAAAQQPLEAFYPRLAANNAGTLRDRGPNWFYYWKTGNVCGLTTGWEYQRGWDYGMYIPGEDHVNVEDSAPTRNSGPETYWNDAGGSVTVTGQGIGPQCCAETVAHELTHKKVYDDWTDLIAAAEADGEHDGDDYDDPDDDGIPNVAEADFLAITTDPNDPDTYNMGGSYQTYGDEEIRCRKAELDTGLTVTEGDDWAYPGSNSFPKYQGE